MKGNTDMQRTLVLVKPDATAKRLGGEIMARLESQGVKIVALKMVRMDFALAESHYAIHRDKPFFDSLIEFITSGPVIAAVLEGEDAIAVVRNAMGNTDPSKAAPGTIRRDLAESIERNAVHGSDGEDTAAVEIATFFSVEELLVYATES